MKKTWRSIAFIVSVTLFAGCANEGENMTGENEMNNHQENHDNMSNQHNSNEDDMDVHMEEEESDHGHSDDQHEEFATAPTDMNPNADSNVIHHQSKNITRLDTSSAVDMSVYISQFVWPATHSDNQPGTVVLVPVEDWQTGLVSTTLIHHPNNGPILFMEDGDISEEILTEIQRLNPKGNLNGTEVMVMGEVGEQQLSQLDDYELEQFAVENEAGFATDIDNYFSDLIGEVPESVIIASSEEEAKLYSLIASNWIAHMNESLLFVDAAGVPEETQEALEKREGNASIYVLGSEDVIEEDTLEKLSEYGDVERISGNTPAEMSIEFALYQDEETSIGWGQIEPGHGLSFVSTETPEIAITGSALGHLGKHAPVIWLEENEISNELYEYLAEIRPTFEDDPMDGPYNHGYLLGGTDTVGFDIQGILDEKLEIAGGHGDH